MRKRMIKLLLGVTTCLVLMGLGMGVVHSATLINNSAGIGWTDGWNQTYAPQSDTAAILVLSPPTLTIEKSVRNVTTGETSLDMVMVMPGEIVEFGISIYNSGDTEAKNIVITDSIPSSTIYETGTATDTNNLDPVNPPDTITFQHAEGGPFNTNDMAPVTAIKWHWNVIDGTVGDTDRTVKFRARVVIP